MRHDIIKHLPFAYISRREHFCLLHTFQNVYDEARFKILSFIWLTYLSQRFLQMEFWTSPEDKMSAFCIHFHKRNDLPFAYISENWMKPGSTFLFPLLDILVKGFYRGHFGHFQKRKCLPFAYISENRIKLGSTFLILLLDILESKVFTEWI